MRYNDELRARVDALEAGGVTELDRLRSADDEGRAALARSQNQANTYRSTIGLPAKALRFTDPTPDAELLRWAHRSPAEREDDEQRRLRSLYGPVSS